MMSFTPLLLRIIQDTQSLIHNTPSLTKIKSYSDNCYEYASYFFINDCITVARSVKCDSQRWVD